MSKFVLELTLGLKYTKLSFGLTFCSWWENLHIYIIGEWEGAEDKNCIY